MRTLLFSILGITLGGFGCSDSGETTPIGGTGGTGTTATGGNATTGGVVATGGTASTTGGTAPATGGTPVATGGTPAATGGTATGGTATATGGTASTTGGATTGGKGNTTGGTASTTGGMSAGGKGSGGKGSTGGSATGGTATGTGGSATGGSGGAVSGTCTASKATGKSVSGSGPHKVVIETNTENGIKCGTIYRPEDLKGTEKYPILVWGEGGCSQDGYSNQAAMGEIASWGYFIVADGTPGGTGACTSNQNGKAFLDYITWAIAENGKPCSAYYQSLETTKIAADGFSCGGLMAENASSDPRFTAIGITSSGLMGGGSSVISKMHAPFKIMNGGESDIAYQNGLNDYDAISAKGLPIVYFSKTSAGHGGDLGQARGDFNSVNLAWLNWQLKGDMGATGKGFLIGSTCKFCMNSGWVFKSANIQ